MRHDDVPLPDGHGRGDQVGRHARVGSARGARAGLRRVTGVMGDGMPWPAKTLPETSVKGARLPMLSPLAVPGVRESSATFLRALGPSRDDARLGGASPVNVRLIRCAG